VEIQSFDRVAVHEDIASTVDSLLRGFDAEAEIRRLDHAGEVVEVERVPLAGQGEERYDERLDRERRREAPRRIEPAPGAPQRRILAFGISRNRLEEAIANTRSAAVVVDSIQDADTVMTLRPYYRRRSGPLRDAEMRGTPIYVLRNNTVSQIEQSLLSMRGAAGELDPTTAALQEAEEAIAAVSFEGKTAIELSPQNAYIRRLQHELASRHGVETSSRGREPFRRVLVVASNGRPLREDAWNQDLRA
jgi:hypothetical protein